jgi:glycine dehydrogenase subunit 2
MNEPLVFEQSRPGRTGYRTPECDVPEADLGTLFPRALLREKPAPLPELSEPAAVRHYTRLSHRNHAVDLGFYPLGSCTMKYNPKINDEVASWFREVHPLQPAPTIQGILEALHRTIESLCAITGMKAGTLQPFAGAHGEFTGMKLFRAWFRKRGEPGRRVLLVPDSAHGTNPASARIAGFDLRVVPSSGGIVTLDAIRPWLNAELAGIMMTNPNTLGLFERQVLEVSRAVHGAGGLLYYDGANLNAIVGTARPGDMGFDVVHLNLHKTFSTPHGGGGPGAGPILVGPALEPFLPAPVIVRDAAGYRFAGAGPDSIGRVSGFHGNIGVILRAFAYILSMGSDGLGEVSRLAVLNANYLRARLRGLLTLPYDALCKHECVFSAKELKERTGVSALDLAKRMLDFGIYAPTVYFPTIVAEAVMIEPTETESPETLDRFVEIVERICREAEEQPELLRAAPHTTPIRRADEVRAARQPRLAWEPPAGAHPPEGGD